MQLKQRIKKISKDPLFAGTAIISLLVWKGPLLFALGFIHEGVNKKLNTARTAKDGVPALIGLFFICFAFGAVLGLIKLPTLSNTAGGELFSGVFFFAAGWYLAHRHQ